MMKGWETRHFPEELLMFCWESGEVVLPLLDATQRMLLINFKGIDHL
jgi:hypothetical protein